MKRGALVDFGSVCMCGWVRGWRVLGEGESLIKENLRSKIT